VNVIRRLLPALLAVVAVVVLGACDSTPTREGKRGPDEPPDIGEERETVVVPKLCVEQLAEFVNRQQLILADHVSIDASSDPFFTAVTATIDPQMVEKKEGIDVAKRMSVLSLKNRTDHANIENLLPQIRVGDGMKVVGTKDIVVRFHNRKGAKRPIYFHLRAYGNVLHYDSHSGRKVRVDQLTVRVEIVQEGDGYMFVAKTE
jgi:hypothetical protein